MNRAFLLLMLFPSLLFAQQVDSLSKRSDWKESYEQRLSETLEEQLQDAEDEVETDVGEYLQALDELREHPLNIHQVDDERLSSLLQFSEYQLYQLRRYTDLHGFIQTPQELACVEGFTVSFVQSVLPYIAFGKPVAKEKFNRKQWSNGKSELLFRYGRAFNARETENDEGSADALLLKYTYRCADVFRLGLVMEKDAGESFFRASNPQGFDYLSAYVSYKGKNRLKHLLLGDYQLQFGQGLSMGMGFQVSDVSPDGLKADAYGLKAHTSANESQFLRGAAAAVAVSRHWDVSMYASVRKLDASMEDGVCRSISTSGYHRTRTELQKESTLRQEVGGAYVSYHGKSLHWGSGACLLHYAFAVESEIKAYNMFRFRGQQLWNVSTDYSWNYRKSVFFGEAVLDPGGNLALVNGWLHPANNRLQFSLLFYSYPYDYHAVSDAMNGTSSLNDEQGLQCKLRLLLGKTGVCDLSCKESVYPWLKYQMDAPSWKRQWQLRYTASSGRESKWLCLYRYRCSQQQELSGNLHVPVDVGKHSLRASWTWSPFADWQFRTQWDAAAYVAGGSAEKGVLFLQSCSFRREKLQLHASFAFFHTDSYRTAIYISENDVRYAMSSAVCSGMGYRSSAVCGYRLSKHFLLNMKLAVTQSFEPDKAAKVEVKAQGIWKG